MVFSALPCRPPPAPIQVNTPNPPKQPQKQDPPRLLCPQGDPRPLREGKPAPPQPPVPTNPHPPQNYKVYCTLNNIPIDDSLADTLPADDTMDVDMEAAEADQNGDDEDEDDDEDMPEFFKDPTDPTDTKTPSRNPKSKVALVVRAKINKVLAETELADKRSRQCDQNDFLRLLLGRLSPVRGSGRAC